MNWKELTAYGAIQELVAWVGGDSAISRNFYGLCNGHILLRSNHFSLYIITQGRRARGGRRRILPQTTRTPRKAVAATFCAAEVLL